MSVRKIIHGGEKRIYLAGPMSNIPHFNFPRFNAVTRVLRLYGHDVFNPAEADIERLGGIDVSEDNATGDQAQAKDKGFSIRAALAEDLLYVCTIANAIVMLPGWERSHGALAEHRTAVAIQSHPSEEMEIIYLTEDECAMMEKTVARIHEMEEKLDEAVG